MNIKNTILSALCLLASLYASAQTIEHQASWLKDAVVYQIYPSS